MAEDGGVLRRLRIPESITRGWSYMSKREAAIHSRRRCEKMSELVSGTRYMMSTLV